MYKVTGNVCGLLSAQAEVMVTFPSYLPTGSSAVSTHTVILMGAVWLAGVADNHDEPLVAS